MAARLIKAMARRRGNTKTQPNVRKLLMESDVRKVSKDLPQKSRKALPSSNAANLGKSNKSGKSSRASNSGNSGKAPIQGELCASTRKGKRYMITLHFEEGRRRTVHFGSSEYDNYTIHKDPDRRARYIERHRRHENWRDPTTPGFWSRWLLWEKPTLDGAIKALPQRFSVVMGPC